MDRLDSKVETEAELKAQLVTTLTTFAETYELVPQVIRQLYKHLMDIDSLLVRAEAIRVAGELLSRIRESVPDDIVELLTIFLPDTYVIIHKAAARALRSCRFQKDERGYKVLNILIHIEKCYRQESKDFYFLRDVFNTLRFSFREWPEVERYVALTLLPAYAGLADEYFAEDMLVLMGEYIGKFPGLASTFVRAALDYLTNTSRRSIPRR